MEFTSGVALNLDNAECSSDVGKMLSLEPHDGTGCVYGLLVLHVFDITLDGSNCTWA